jgi:hypothetical protein
MPVGNAAAEVAVELEKVRGKLPELFALENTFFNLVNQRTKTDKVSYRPERIPFQVSNGVKGRAVSLDGGDLGRGGGPQMVFGSLAPVEFDWIIEWTKHAEIATDSREKSVADYAKIILKAHMKAAQHDLDSMIIFGDGANTIGIVTPNTNIGGNPFYTTGTPAIIYVDNAARFRQGADYDYYNGGPGTTVTGTFTVTGIDYANKALYVATTLAVAITSGSYIIFNNSTGVLGSGINGIQDLNQTATTGTFMGITKSANPGSFNGSAINAGGATLTPAIARLLLNTLLLNAGVEEGETSDYLFMSGLGQKAAWENTAIAQTQVIQPGNATGRDMLPAVQITTIGGIKLMASRKYIPGRIDLLNLSTWFTSEVQPLDYYSVGGQEQFWPMGASGGIAASMLKYLIWVGNIGCDNPKLNAVIYNLQEPIGY